MSAVRRWTWPMWTPGSMRSGMARGYPDRTDPPSSPGGGADGAAFGPRRSGEAWGQHGQQAGEPGAEAGREDELQAVSLRVGGQQHEQHAADGGAPGRRPERVTAGAPAQRHAE